MEPMKPMQPMKPMEPMKPMSGGEAWWPKDLGSPSSSGSQNGLRYAVFTDAKRLLIERDGRTETFDTGEHVLNGVQQSSHDGAIVFSGRNGPVPLDRLQRLD